MNIINTYNEGKSNYWIGSRGQDNFFVHGEKCCLDKSINDLILDPKYNFIPTLMANDEFKDAFIKWITKITEEEIMYCENDDAFILNQSYGLSELAILGYQIEFIKENTK
jgi:hypothetical protein